MNEPTRTRLDRRLALEAAVIMALAAGLCFSCLVAGSALFDGPDAALRTLEGWWSFAAAVSVVGLVVGYLSGLMHQRWISEHLAAPTDAPLPTSGREGILRLGLIRFWVLMPLNFAPAAFGVVWASLSGSERVRDGSGVVPVWFQLGPLMMSWPLDEDFLGSLPTLPRLQQGMLRWAWWLPVMILVAIWGGEIYGEPAILRPLGTYWAGDYVGLWWLLRALSSRSA